MRRLLFRSVCVLALLCPSVFSQAEGDTTSVSRINFGMPLQRDFLGGGARAKAMGGAAFAVSDEASSASWNPAGLFSKDNPLERPVLGVGLNVFSPSSKFELGGDLDATGINPGQTFQFDDTFSDLALFSFAAPIRIKGHPFVISGIFSRLDNEFLSSAFDYDTAFFTQDVQGDSMLTPLSIDQSRVFHPKINSINVGFGTRLYDNLSFGITTNIYQGSGVVEEQWLRTLRGVPAPDLTAGQRITQVIDSLDLDSVSYSGIFFTLGFKYEIEKLSLGLVVRTPHALSETVDRSVFRRETRNGNPRTDGSDTTFLDDNLIEVDQPLVVGVGAGFKALKNLLLAADIEYRGFSGGQIKVRDAIELIPGAADREFFTTRETEWSDVVAFRVGGEYGWQTGSETIPLVPLRAGFAFAPSPFDGDNPEQPFRVQSNSVAVKRLSAGFGLHWMQIKLDFAYVRSTLDIENQYQITGAPAVFTERSDNTHNSFDLTFTGYF